MTSDRGAPERRGVLERLLIALGVPDGPPVRHPSAPARRTQRSLAHEAVLAMLDPDRGRTWDSFGARFCVVPAALLVELVHEGRLEVSQEGRKTRATVSDATPLGDPDVDAALLRIRAIGDGRTVAGQVGVLPGTTQIVDTLLERGELTAETGRRLGLFTTRRLRPSTWAVRDEIVGRVSSALLGESVPDDRTALLLAVLGLGVPARRFVPREAVKDADRRAAEILERLDDDERAIIAAVREARDRSDRS